MKGTMIRVALAGGPGTGKTTLARHLANELSMTHGLSTYYVSEYARDYIAAVQTSTDEPYEPQMSDQLLFIDEQKKREEEAPDNVDVIITDSPIFLTAIYAWRVHDDAFYRDTEQYLNIYRRLIKEGINHQYDFIFVLPSIKGQLEDGIRVQTIEDSKQITKQAIGFLQFHQMPFITLDNKTLTELSDVMCKFITGEYKYNG